MDLISDMQELVSCAKLYLLQNFAPTERIVGDFSASMAPRASKELPPQPKRQPLTKQQPPPKQPPQGTGAPQVAPSPAVTQAPPAVAKAPPAVAKAPPAVAKAPPAVAKAPPTVTKAPPPLEAPPQPLPSRPREPYLQALCRPVELAGAPLLDDIRERLTRLAPGRTFLAAPEPPQEASWKHLYPACIVVSYAPGASEMASFLQHVIQAISERLCPCALYEATSSPARLGEIQAEIVAISPRAIIVAGNRGVEEELRACIATCPQMQVPLQVPTDVPPTHTPFVRHGTVNGAPAFILSMTPTEVHDIGFKKQLWRSLQLILR